MSRFSLNFLRRSKRNRFKARQSNPLALRLSVFRSNRNVSVQLIDDQHGVTLCSESSLCKEVVAKFGSGDNKDVAFFVGQLMARKVLDVARDASVYFDRGGFAYHGRVKALADGMRDGGLRF